MKRLIFISGLSGSGKSIALHALEDIDYYCIDNIPAALLKQLISHTLLASDSSYERIAIGLDARNTDAEIATVPNVIEELRQSGIQCDLVFLVASDEELLRRYSETRRKHPMSRHGESLREAIALERRLLEPVLNQADLVVDTSHLGVHALRDLLNLRVDQRPRDRMSVLAESFGFKYGIPGDADFVFDARSLPNPYWEPRLRPLTGLDDEVIRFLESQASVRRFIDDVVTFMTARIPEHRAGNRRYLTIAVGCTGGQHRSVYIVEQLAARLSQSLPDIRTRHSGLVSATTDSSSAHRR